MNVTVVQACAFSFSSRRRHTRYWRDWSSDVCSSDLFVDPHFHMDATLSHGLPRVNRSGTLLEGIALWGELKPLLTAEALISRALEYRSEEHTSELQSRQYLVCRLLLEKKKKRAIT